jgi:hypothetical protein
MKNVLKAVALVLAVAAPAVSFSQTSQPLTRAQVKAELVQLEKAGYNPAQSGDTAYPANIQAAEARVQAGAPKADSGFGAGTDGSSKSGPAIKHQRPADDIYFGN